MVRPINTKGKKPVITQGYRNGHKAVDYAYAEGTKVYSPITGKIIEIVNYYVNNWKKPIPNSNKNYGNYIKVENDKGEWVILAHLKKDSIKFNVGDKVKEGQWVAEVGNTGWSTGPHLHFEYKLNGEYKQPSEFMDFDFEGYFEDRVKGSPIKSYLEISTTEKLPEKFYQIEEARRLIEKDLLEKDDAFDTILQKYYQLYLNNDIKIKTLAREKSNLEDRVISLGIDVTVLEKKLEEAKKSKVIEKIVDNKPKDDNSKEVNKIINNTMESKKWYESKTLWLNVAAFIGASLQTATDTFAMPLEVQTGLLAVANLLVRFKTDKKLTK